VLIYLQTGRIFIEKTEFPAGPAENWRLKGDPSGYFCYFPPRMLLPVMSQGVVWE
jgi:hypothetical protein